VERDCYYQLDGGLVTVQQLPNSSNPLTVSSFNEIFLSDLPLFQGIKELFLHSSSHATIDSSSSYSLTTNNRVPRHLFR
jgi:hypothetical protein